MFNVLTASFSLVQSLTVLSLVTHVTDTWCTVQVKIWFQNRRTKWKKQNPGLDVNSAPPALNNPQSAGGSTSAPSLPAGDTTAYCDVNTGALQQIAAAVINPRARAALQSGATAGLQQYWLLDSLRIHDPHLLQLLTSVNTTSALLYTPSSSSAAAAAAASLVSTHSSCNPFYLPHFMSSHVF